MKIHREGYKILGGMLLMMLTINALAYFLLSDYPLFLMLVMFLSLIKVFLVAYFFRNPHFVPEKVENNILMAPADGRIVAIEEVEEPEYFKDKRIQVSIFMSPANAHVNRNPIDGKVVYSQYHPGNYMVAWHPKSSTLNERFTTVIQTETEEMEILVRQIAGKLARKISNYLEVGETVEQGNELGFIKFGSRVDLFLPLDAKINIDLKDRVKAGKTVLAVLKDSPNSLFFD